MQIAPERVKMPLAWTPLIRTSCYVLVVCASCTYLTENFAHYFWWSQTDWTFFVGLVIANIRLFWLCWVTYMCVFTYTNAKSPSKFPSKYQNFPACNELPSFLLFRGGKDFHWLVYLMRLSIDPPFSASVCHRMPPFSLLLHPVTPYFCFFDQTLPAKSSNFEEFCKSQRKFQKIVLKLPAFCAISPSMNPLFRICHPITLFFGRKLSLTALWFDALIGAPPSLVYVSAPGFFPTVVDQYHRDDGGYA